MSTFNDSKLRELRKLFIEWSKDSSSHGIPNIFKSRSIILKIMWTISVLVSLGFAIFLVVRSISSYYDYEVTTKIRVIEERPILFPAVTICNLNPFATNKGSEFILNHFNDLSNQDGGKKIQNYSDIYNYMFEKNNKDYKQTIKSINDQFEIVLQKASDSILTNDQKKQLGYSIDEMIVNSYFNNDIFTENEFIWYYYTSLGNCYKFNSGYDSSQTKVPLKKLYISGNLYGLNLELFVGSPKNNTLFSYARSSGIRVFIYNQTILPSFTEGIDVQTGKCANIQINKVFSSTLSNPFSSCDNLDSFNSILYNYMKNTGYTYRTRDCWDLCYQMSTITQCDCLDLRYQNLNSNLKPCYLNATKYNCMITNYLNFVKLENNENCSKECPSECDTISYDIITSFSDFPSKDYSEILIRDTKLQALYSKTNITLDDLKESLVCLNLYFEDFTYTSITETIKFENIDLIANLGGTLGLFLGISLLSFVEIIELIIEIAILLYK